MTTQIVNRWAILAVVALAVLPTHSALIGSGSGVTASPRVTFDADYAESDYLNAGVASVAPKRTELASASTESSDEQRRQSAKALIKRFQAMGYELDMIRDGDAPVPRVFISTLPEDLHALRQVELKKSVFFKTTLPLILKENEHIAEDRERLLRLVRLIKEGETLSDNESTWLAQLAVRYKTDVDDLNTLLARVDVIPVSLAMAQSAEESGWGTSRFAQNGNALFGQWTTADDDGLVPEERPDGKTHKVKAFDNLADSVAGYMRNLNTHGAYRSFRAERSQMRARGVDPDGRTLAGELTKYSARGQKYVDSIRLIIDANGLRSLDDATLFASDGGEQEV